MITADGLNYSSKNQIQGLKEVLKVSEELDSLVTKLNLIVSNSN